MEGNLYAFFCIYLLIVAVPKLQFEALIWSLKWNSLSVFWNATSFFHTSTFRQICYFNNRKVNKSLSVILLCPLTTWRSKSQNFRFPYLLKTTPGECKYVGSLWRQLEIDHRSTSGADYHSNAADWSFTGEGCWEARSCPHQQSLFHCCFISCALTFFLTYSSSCLSLSLLIAQRTHTQRLKVSKRHLRHSQHSRHTVIYLIYTTLELPYFTLSHSQWVRWRTWDPWNHGYSILRKIR